MKATEKQKLQMKEYASRPEVKAKRKEYMKNYRLVYDVKNKERISKRKKEYYLKNKKYINERNKKWKENNKDKIYEWHKINYLKNRDKLLLISRKWYESVDKKEYRRKKRNWENNKVKNDLNFKIKKTLRVRILKAFNLYTKTGKILNSKEYGIDYEGIIKYLSKTIPKDIKEKNYVIDHIIPLCSFDLTNPEEIKKAFAPENHRWLLAEENARKVSQDRKMSIHPNKFN